MNPSLIPPPELQKLAEAGSQSPLIPINDVKRIQAAGLPFDTEHSVRWAHRKRAENGLSACFFRIGRRWFIDPAIAHAIVRQRGAPT